ncbi:MAG: hypothetical protein ACYSUC_12060 [Planctomycetota bacterium]|jgi:hypothetical protein
MAEILRLDFEEGDLTDFDSTTNESNMAANGTAAMVGSYGVEYTYSSAAPPRGEINTSVTWPVASGETGYRIYFDPNNLSMGAGDDFYLCYQRCDGTVNAVTSLWEMQLYESGADYDLQLSAKDDSDATLNLTLTALSDAQHYVEVYCKRATSDVASDGVLQAWIDGVEISGGLSNIDNYDLFQSTNEVRIGVAAGADATTSGTFYLDDIIFRDDNTRIGGANPDLSISVTPGDIAYYTQGIRVK